MLSNLDFLEFNLHKLNSSINKLPYLPTIRDYHHALDSHLAHQVFHLLVLF